MPTSSWQSPSKCSCRVEEDGKAKQLTCAMDLFRLFLSGKPTEMSIILSGVGIFRWHLQEGREGRKVILAVVSLLPCLLGQKPGLPTDRGTDTAKAITLCGMLKHANTAIFRENLMQAKASSNSVEDLNGFRDCSCSVNVVILGDITKRQIYNMRGSRECVRLVNVTALCSTAVDGIYFQVTIPKLGL